MVLLSNDHLTIEVAPMGAELQSIVTADGASWLWNGDPAFWTGRSPLLFPVVGKSADGAVTIDGASYPMQPHGFARRSLFELVDSSATACTFELRASDATRQSFPFDFALRVTYALEGETLDCAISVSNLSGKPFPFSFGFHPAFVWPLPGSEGTEHFVELGAGAAPALSRLAASGLLSPDRLPSPFTNSRIVLSPTLFEADAMIFLSGTGDSALFGSTTGAFVEARFRGLPQFAIWSKPGAGFVCLEPWRGAAAVEGAGPALLDRPGAMELAAGGIAEFGLGLRFGRG